MRRVRRVQRVAEGHIFQSILKTSSILSKILVLHKFRMTLRIFQITEGLFLSLFSVPLCKSLHILNNTEGLFLSLFSVPFCKTLRILNNTEGFFLSLMGCAENRALFDCKFETVRIGRFWRFKR